MNQPSQGPDPLEPMPEQAASAPAEPTPATISTSPHTAAPLTRSMQPTLGVSTSDPNSVPPAIRPGAVLDGYVLLEQIGRGGMGVVFKARQPSSEQTVAVKIIRDSLFGDAEARARFILETRAMGRLQSARNIMPIFHVGQHEGCLFLVMPYFSGGPLSSRRKVLPNEPTKAVALVEKLARAVHHLHVNNILHRDIKPGNVLLDADDEPYLSDFGLAKFCDQDQSVTGTQQRLGTPAYMAPEQTGLVPTPTSPQTDIWALGIILYELLTGVRPFVALDSEVSSTLLWKIVHETPARPRNVRADIDPGLEAVILKCLEKNPADRFASAAELADELGRWQRQENLLTPRYSFGNNARRFVRRHPRVTAALALTAALLLVAAAVAYDFRRRSSPEYIHDTLRGKLIADEKIVLIPDKGAPTWFHNVFGYRMMTGVNENGHWRVDSPENWGLVELLRDVPFERYKLRAEVLHLKSERVGGRIGIFLAHHTYTHEKSTPHFWPSLVYNDIIATQVPPPLIGKVPPLKGNNVQLWWEIYSNNGTDQPVVDRWQGPGTHFDPATVLAAKVKGDIWRVLEMELHPDKIVGRFDDKGMREQARAALEADVQSTLRDRAAKEAKYAQLGDVANVRLNANGSLGLVVCNGSIVVRNVTVTRIPDP